MASMLDIDFSDKSSVMRAQHMLQILLCLYGARFSYVAITNLRKYEETTKKLAEWSQMVDDQLYLTRTTQAAGAMIILASFLAATVLLLASQYLHIWVKYCLSPTMLIGVLFARNYVKNYWAPYKDKDGKDVGTRVPLPNMAAYNEAEEMTERMLEVLQYLEYSWLATSFFAGFGMTA